MDLFSTLLVVICFYFTFQKKECFNLGDLKFILPAWLGVVALGLLLGTAGFRGFSHIFEWKWILALFSIIWIQQKNQITEISWTPFWIILSVSSIYAILGWAMDYDPIMQAPLSDLGRAGGFFYDPMTFAHVNGQYLCLIMGILLGEFYERKFKVVDENPWLVFAVLTTGIAVLVAFTRGIWGACALALIIMAFFTNSQFAWRLSTLLTLIFLGLFYTWPQFHDRILFVFDFQKNYDGDRVALWKANWEMFLDHPLLGIGYGEYKTILRSYFDRLDMPPSQFASHAHNQYLHFLAGTGILGLTCFLSYVGYGIKTTIQGIRNTTQSLTEKRFLIGALGAQVCFLIGGLTESNFERSKVRLVYLIISGLAIATVLKKKNLNKC